MFKRIILGALTAALMLTVVPASANHPTENYVAGSAGDGAAFCAEENPANVNIGGACFPAVGGKTYTVTVKDATELAVGWYFEFKNSAGHCVGTTGLPTEDCVNNGFRCGNATLPASPGGTAELVIILDGPVFGPLDCGFIDGEGPETPGAATNGTIKISHA